MKKRKLILLSIVGLCMGCSTSPQRIPEDLTSTNIIEDNYRNFYEIFVRSFADSNGDGIGDLQGVIDKLDYIKELGFNGIWLMPINKGSSYHKYDVIDYYEIDPTFGSMADLEKLISECHKRNIKLIIDLVLNHSSPANEWYKKAVAAHEKELLGLSALTDEEKKFKDFYNFYDSQKDIPSGTTCYKVSSKDFYVEANFSSGMPEFNCDSEYVREEFKNIIEFYLNKGLDGFRLDAVKYYYIGNTTKNVNLLSEFNKWAKAVNKDAYIVGECWDATEIIQNYYGSGIDSFFNFSTSVSNSSSPIVNSLNQEGRMLNRYYNGLLDNVSIAKDHIPAPFLDNHDMPRYSSQVNATTNKFKYGLLSMMNGATYTYYGDEIGMVGNNTGGRDENVRISIPWGEDDPYVCKMISNVSEYSYPHGTVEEQLNDKNSILNYYKKSLLLRNQNPEIARGEISLVSMDREEAKSLFIKKTYNEKSIGIIFNFSPQNDISIDYGKEGFLEVVGQLVVDDEKYITKQDEHTIMLPPYSIAIVR